jgi:hypothetical protein
MAANHLRKLITHPLSLVGAGLAIFSFLSIVSMIILEGVAGSSNPYTGLFIYMIYPGLMLFGLVLMPIGALLERRGDGALSAHRSQRRQDKGGVCGDLRGGIPDRHPDIDDQL